MLRILVYMYKSVVKVLSDFDKAQENMGPKDQKFLQTIPSCSCSDFEGHYLVDFNDLL